MSIKCYKDGIRYIVESGEIDNETMKKLGYKLLNRFIDVKDKNNKTICFFTHYKTSYQTTVIDEIETLNKENAKAKKSYKNLIK